MRWARLLPAVVGAGLLAWGAGLLVFLAVAQASPAPAPARVDGIVALTGAPGRVDAALRLLAEGRAGRLLVSGVAPGSSLEDIAHHVAGLGALAGRTTVGHQATSTHGNALETAGWARAHDMHSLLIVTSSWHMKRAMVELSRALPDVALYAAPVPVNAEHRLTSSLAGWRLLAEEYSKWLVVAAGLAMPDAGAAAGDAPDAAGPQGAVSRNTMHGRSA